MKKTISLLVLIVILVVSFSQILFAVSKNELNAQNSNLNNKISETEDEIDEINGQISSSMQEVQKLDAQINDYQQAISELDRQIGDLTTKITETENTINEKQKELEEKQDLLNRRLVKLYESGNTSYIELLLSSADLSDFISKYYLISELATYDTELIESIRKAKQVLEDSKIQLQNNKTAVETAKAEQVKKRNELASAKKEKETKVASLSAEEKELEKSLEDFEAEKSRIQNQLAEIARKEEEERKKAAESQGKTYTTNTGSGSSYGYIFPVAGLSKANIRTKAYPSYPGHTGVDVNINVSGKKVVAVKAGTVVTSMGTPGSIIWYNSDGSRGGAYSHYGEYVIINHHDGTMTLYGHMLPGSRTVSKGQEVSQGQVIGTVGNTGNVLPRPSSSNPSAGTHLHFEVRTGIYSKAVNPLPYLP